ncbi:conserved hypothetical protein [Histoplasma capsulatum var. duboisii H88]|uniref:Uncharacterized protein n=2 Tax=Ajellomyces capsulatus TaxID=5037 RepID=F0U504_AJEC8|nr:conserved hypothetical protein [Histoplasma capsulatum H143]EGC42047.1 conserved hypothetical protein [Histoplasma capsulatum var. duboisii H88]
MATSLMLISWSRTAPSLTPLTGRYFLTIKYDGSMLCSTSVPSSEEDREWKALLRNRDPDGEKVMNEVHQENKERDSLNKARDKEQVDMVQYHVSAEKKRIPE